MVTLELASDDGSPEVVEVLVAMPQTEIDVLHRFTALVQRVRESALLQRGMSGFQGIKLEGGQFTISAGECSSAELSELLHVLRPVTLEREAASFSRAASLIGRRLTHPTVRRFISLNQRAFKDGQMSLFLQVQVGAQRLFDESLLNTWLNGTQYHTDEEKAVAWSRLEASLGSSNARALVVSQLHSKVVAIFNVDYIVRKLLSERDGA